MSMPALKFIPTLTPYDRKRKQSHRACEDCRRKKKRCAHDPEDVPENISERVTGQSQYSRSAGDSLRRTTMSQPANSTPTHAANALEGRPYAVSAIATEGEGQSLREEHAATSVPSGEEEIRENAGSAQAEGQPDHDSRFIGDMNPEGIFFSTAGLDARQHTSTRGSIGVWTSKQRGHNRDFTERFAAPLPRASLFYGLKPTIQRAIIPILEEECVSTIPPHAHRVALQTAYFSRFHPLLPIVDISAYHSFPHDSPSRLLLDQGICLVASMDSSLGQHLYLSDDLRLLPLKDFGHRLLAAMKTSIEIGRVTDRLLCVQLLALMSLFQEGPDGCEDSTSALGRAVQHLHYLGLHLRKERGDSQCKHAETLFCCLWFLDRLSAASQGRPTLMHERDISRSMRESFEAQEPSFQLLLRIAALLDEVVSLYRPDCIDDKFVHDFILFEDLAVDCQAVQTPPDLLATIEVMYHAVAILSCHPVSGSTHDRTPSSSRRTRQFWSAQRATELVYHEFRDQLVPFPFVPYAVSLSLSVNYRELRRSKVPAHRARAKIGLEVNCSVLEEFREISGSAAVMADMGNLTLTELNRLYTSAKEDEYHRNLTHGHTESSAEVLQEQVSPLRPAETGTEASPMIPQDFDICFFSDMAGLDPFDMFDPRCNLDSIDSFLEGNLDPANSM